MTTITLAVGQDISFNYNGKPRSGIIEKVGDNYIIVKLHTDSDSKEYKSFTIAKMQDVSANNEIYSCLACEELTVNMSRFCNKHCEEVHDAAFRGWDHV